MDAAARRRTPGVNFSALVTDGQGDNFASICIYIILYIYKYSEYAGPSEKSVLQDRHRGMYYTSVLLIGIDLNIGIGKSFERFDLG